MCSTCTWGVAQHCARARTAPDDVRIRQAMASQTHGAGLFTCPSSGPSARVAPAAAWTGRGSCFGRWFRHGPWRETTRHVRHRPAPVSRLPAFRRQEVGPRPGGWLCTTLERPARQRNRVGHRLPPGPGTRYAGPRRAFLPPGPTRSRSIRRRKRRHDGTGAEGVEKRGNNLASRLPFGLSPPLWGRKQNHGLGGRQVMDLAREGETRNVPLTCDF